MWTAGLAMFTTADFRTKCKNILLNPCIVTVFLGIARRITGFPVPEFLDTAIANTGAVTTPLSMMVIGTMASPMASTTLVSMFSIARPVRNPATAISAAMLR